MFWPSLYSKVLKPWTLKICNWLVSPFHQKSPINKFEPCTYFNMCGWNLCMAISLVLFKFCILHSSIWLFTDRETAAALVSDLESTIYWAHFVHNIILVCCFVYNLCSYIIICKTGQILEHRIRWRVLDRMIHACKHFNIFLPLLYNLCRFCINVQWIPSLFNSLFIYIDIYMYIYVHEINWSMERLVYCR